MESSESSSAFRDAGGLLFSKPARPSLTLPPRNPADAFVRSSDVTPSPMTFVSSLFADQEPDTDFKSFSQMLAGAMSSPTSRMADSPTNTGFSRAQTFGGSGITTGGSFADRLADRGAEPQGSGGGGSSGGVRSNTARFKSMTPSRLPIQRSFCLTIPPGLSPTTLLDSPVLLSTGQAEPSPTTGTFPLPPFIQESGLTGSATSDSSKDRTSDQDGSPSFVFKPFPIPGKNSSYPLANPGYFGHSHQQGPSQIQGQVHSVSSSSSALTSAAAPMPTGTLVSAVNASKPAAPLQCEAPPEPTSQLVAAHSENVQAAQLPALPAPLVVERPSEDGYNWRKYGQKQVKGSEYPRSYYKCTHPSCPVKKKVERSHDGQVTEIVYKGEHNHSKPQATRRSAMAAAHFSDGGSTLSAMVADKAEGPNGHGHSVDGKSDLISSAADPSKGQRVPLQGGANATPEPSSGSTSNDEGEDGDGSKVEDGDDDEPDSKRRKGEKPKDTVTPLRTIREPRVVVQTPSDVDILDDGYRWRKYGQKVVKGNPHPRSYYKCTNNGCLVRKQVERSSTDPKAVITTYEGKHNHDVPVARNSHHDTSLPTAAATATPPPPGPAQSSLASSSANTVVKPSPSLQDQLHLGMLLEDRSKTGVGNGDIMGVGSLASDQRNRVQGGADMFAQSSMSLMGSGASGVRAFEGSGSFGQGLGLRPKEEQFDNHSLVTSLQPTFSSNSSFSHGMPQGLLLEP